MVTTDPQPRHADGTYGEKLEVGVARRLTQALRTALGHPGIDQSDTDRLADQLAVLDDLNVTVTPTAPADASEHLAGAGEKSLADRLAEQQSLLDALEHKDVPYWETIEFKRDFPQEKRDEYAKSGIALPDGSYPIPDKDALRRAITSYGRGNADKGTVKAHIVKRARALGATDMLPDDWTAEEKRFNPRQVRDKDGKWTDVPGGEAPDAGKHHRDVNGEPVEVGDTVALAPEAEAGVEAFFGSGAADLTGTVKSRHKSHVLVDFDGDEQRMDSRLLRVVTKAKAPAKKSPDDPEETKLFGRHKKPSGGGSSFDESEHPRDYAGRFASVGSTVTLPSGEEGTVTGNVGNGRIRVQRAGGDEIDVQASQTRVKRSANWNRANESINRQLAEGPPTFATGQRADEAFLALAGTPEPGSRESRRDLIRRRQAAQREQESAQFAGTGMPDIGGPEPVGTPVTALGTDDEFEFGGETYKITDTPRDEPGAMVIPTDKGEIRLGRYTSVHRKAAEDPEEIKAGGADRNRGGAEKLRRYWTHGEGAAKIRWGTPGDHMRCVRQLMEHAGFTEAHAHGYCNLREKEATGLYPAQHAAATKKYLILHELEVKAGPGPTYNGSAMVALYPPDDVAQALALPGGLEPEDLHVTLAYLGDAADVPKPDKLTALIGELADDSYHMTGSIGGLARFPGEDGNGDALVALVDVPELTDFRTDVVDALEDAGYEVSRTHGFTPHITLAYLDEGEELPVAHIPRLPVTFKDVSVSVGSDVYDYVIPEDDGDLNDDDGTPGTLEDQAEAEASAAGEGDAAYDTSGESTGGGDGT